ncbi:hypothetical protein DdX_22021 [Ditylenchus destructor]|uniref:Uncharacterized protein n=1 Tax=Ditylenchus destructor TaxID=166010 RepID=A0AAD4MFF6_9BILA|nr:hypothetical protein DdX_22021 [Ditylenchus destructor]
MRARKFLNSPNRWRRRQINCKLGYLVATKACAAACVSQWPRRWRRISLCLTSSHLRGFILMSRWRFCPPMNRSTYQPGETDVAIRVVVDRNTLPQNLHGLKGPEISSGVYMSRKLLASWRADADVPIRWIVKNRYGDLDKFHQSNIPASEIPFRTTDAAAQIVAVQQGLGMTSLLASLVIRIHC